jgi:hypothetical protein
MSAVLTLRITGSAGAYNVSAEVGGRNDSDTLGQLPAKLRENLESLGSHASIRERLINVLPAGAATHVKRFVETKRTRKIGSDLFDYVFQPAVYKLYQGSLEEALVTGQRVYIKLRVEPPELSYVPWEIMFDKRRLFYVSCSQQTPFARAGRFDEQDLHIFDKLPLRVLCMVSAPNDFVGTPYELKTGVALEALDRMLEPLKLEGEIKLCWTAGTQRELTNRLMQGDDGEKWDVLLLIGPVSWARSWSKKMAGPAISFWRLRF